MRPPGGSSRGGDGGGSALALLGLALLGLASPSAAASANDGKPRPPSKDAILLSDVRALTLRAGRQTTSRRAPAVPQLRCVSTPPAICDRLAADAVGGVLRCENAGPGAWGPEDVQWSCTAPAMPAELRLGATDVQCEGYRSPDDDWVLRGSCGVEYRLLLTEAGERRYPELARGADGGRGPGRGNDLGGQPDWGARAFAVVFVAVTVWILYSAFCAAAANNRRAPRNPRPRGGGGGGGGGFGPGGGGYHDDNDDDVDDPPPPYPGTGPSSRPKKSSSSSRQQQQRQGAAGGWRPGFWSGLAGGAAAGYAAGNWGNGPGRRQDHNDRRGGWGNGSGSGFPSSSSNSSGSSSGSPARYESTGFGSTSRR